jgi:hypothetical protein
MADIKEEIIEFNPKLKIITRYCIVVECATNTMSGLIRTWKDKVKSIEK